MTPAEFRVLLTDLIGAAAGHRLKEVAILAVNVELAFKAAKREDPSKSSLTEGS